MVAIPLHNSEPPLHFPFNPFSPSVSQCHSSINSFGPPLPPPPPAICISLHPQYLLGHQYAKSTSCEEIRALPSAILQCQQLHEHVIGNAGLLKGTTPAQFEQLRQHFLEKVDVMFPAKKRSKKGPSLPQKGTHSTPY